MNEVEFIQSISTLEVREGDVVVIRVGHLLSDGQYEKIEKAVKHHFPHNKVMLLEAGMDVGVIRTTIK